LVSLLESLNIERYDSRQVQYVISISLDVSFPFGQCKIVRVKSGRAEMLESLLEDLSRLSYSSGTFATPHSIKIDLGISYAAVPLACPVPAWLDRPLGE
jgi:hypothetical protein